MALPRHAHALRHTCANELLRSGATIADVQRLLGHASIKTTSIYLSSDEQRQEDVITHRDRERLAIDEDLDTPTLTAPLSPSVRAGRPGGP